MEIINGILNFIHWIFEVITNLPVIVFSFITYWFVGWGLVIVGIILIGKWGWKFFDDYYITTKVEKTYLILGVILVGVMLWFVPAKVMHFAIDVDPYNQTEEEIKYKESIKGVGEEE